ASGGARRVRSEALKPRTGGDATAERADAGSSRINETWKPPAEDARPVNRFACNRTRRPQRIAARGRQRVEAAANSISPDDDRSTRAVSIVGLRIHMLNRP